MIDQNVCTFLNYKTKYFTTNFKWQLLDFILSVLLLLLNGIPWAWHATINSIEFIHISTSKFICWLSVWGETGTNTQTFRLVFFFGILEFTLRPGSLDFDLVGWFSQPWRNSKRFYSLSGYRYIHFSFSFLFFLLLGMSWSVEHLFSLLLHFKYHFMTFFTFIWERIWSLRKCEFPEYWSNRQWTFLTLNSDYCS